MSFSRKTVTQKSVEIKLPYQILKKIAPEWVHRKGSTFPQRSNRFMLNSNRKDGNQSPSDERYSFILGKSQHLSPEACANFIIYLSHSAAREKENLYSKYLGAQQPQSFGYFFLKTLGNCLLAWGLDFSSRYRYKPFSIK